jgi:DNA invertase Pin-like site-specific DNA recombinase
MESNVPFLAPHNPHATNFTIHILAAVAEHEAKQRSACTRAALAQSKKKLGGYRGGPGRAPGSRLGSAAVRAKADAFTARVRPTIEALRAEGKSLHQIAAELSARGVMTSRGGQ